MRRYLVLAVLVGMLVAVLPAVASSETSPTVTAENIGGFYGEEHRWTPSQVTVSTVGGVTLSNPTEVKHGVHWISPPSTPTCDSGVPVGTTETASGTKWSGTCKFTQAGTYTYYCTVHGAAMSGTITVKTPGTPTAATGLPTEVTQTGARLGGTIKPEGNATSYYFKYGPTISMEQKIPLSPESVGSSDFAEHAVSATLTALSPNTEYHFELVATYGTSSTVLGFEKVFMTPPLEKPKATTGQATAVTPTGATLKGIVSPEGQATTYYFRYGLSASYEHETGPEQTGPEGANHPASAVVTELAPNTVYHFRLVAKNEAGPAEGEDHTFKTEPPPSTTTTTTTPTTTTTTPTTPTPPPTTTTLVEPPPGPPIAGSPSLRASQHGSSVRGSLDVSQTGAGGRLEVDLLAKGASLAKVRRSGSGSVRVGRLVRASVSAGKVSFSVSLTARGKSALRRHHRLALTVKITFTPRRGEAATIMRSVVVRA
jgi:plastocyanin